MARLKLSVETALTILWIVAAIFGVGMPASADPSVDLGEYAIAVQHFYERDGKQLEQTLSGDAEALRRYNLVRAEMHGPEENGTKVTAFRVGMRVTASSILSNGTIRAEVIESVQFQCIDGKDSVINSGLAQPHVLIVDAKTQRVLRDEFTPWSMMADPPLTLRERLDSALKATLVPILLVVCGLLVVKARRLLPPSRQAQG